MLERNGKSICHKTFTGQLWFVRQVQRLFGNERASNVAIQIAARTKWNAQAIIRDTHGDLF